METEEAVGALFLVKEYFWGLVSELIYERSVLVSARLSGLVYKVLSEHDVCKNRESFFELKFTCLLFLCLSLSISISAFSVLLQSVLLYILCVLRNTLPHNARILLHDGSKDRVVTESRR